MYRHGYLEMKYKSTDGNFLAVFEEKSGAEPFARRRINTNGLIIRSNISNIESVLKRIFTDAMLIPHRYIYQHVPHTMQTSGPDAIDTFSWREHEERDWSDGVLPPTWRGKRHTERKETAELPATRVSAQRPTQGTDYR